MTLTTSPKSIAILLPDLRGGGAERVGIDLARAFRDSACKVEFVLMNAVGDFLPEVERDFLVFDLCVKNVRRVPLRFARYLDERRPDALIANMWPLTSAAVLGRLLACTSTRLLLVEHTTLSNQYASWGNLHSLMMRTSLFMTYRWADDVAAVSEGAARNTAKLAGLNSKHVAVLCNPIPQRAEPTPEASATAERFWGHARGQRILTVGSLKVEKNHPLLLRAFAALSQPGACLMILGGGDATALRCLATELGISDRVIFAGFHLDPSPFYATADLFVLSSDYEGFGNVIVEALSFGLPVVSTDCPSGPAEILEGGRWGRLVPVGDADTLAGAMEMALLTPVNRDALKRRAADFAPEIAARKYLELLEVS